MNIEKERKAFEGWYEKAYLNTDIGYLMHNGQYSSRRKQHSWDAWQASANREGYKFVPVDVNYEMIEAGMDALKHADEFNLMSEVYKAMIGVCDDH